MHKKNQVPTDIKNIVTYPNDIYPRNPVAKLQ